MPLAFYLDFATKQEGLRRFIDSKGLLTPRIGSLSCRPLPPSDNKGRDLAVIKQILHGYILSERKIRDPMIRIVMKNGNKLLLFMFLCLIVSCKHGINDSGNIPMEEFSIRNKSLDSIVRNTLTQLNIDTCQEVVVLDLMWVNNEKVYLLSVQKKSDLMDSYVSWYNRRIVGYTAIGNYLTIILSNVDNHGDFLDIFASDLDLGEKIREFTFMHVPENRYRWITVEGHQLPWQDKAYLYEPTFVVCRPRGGDGYEIIYSNSPFDDAETGTQREYGACSPNFRAGVPLTKGQK